MNAYFGSIDDPQSDLVVEKDYVAAASPGKLPNPGYLIRDHEGQRVQSVMRWGFPLPNGKPVVNVRNYTSPFWRGSLKNPHFRCLVPATRFQEWTVNPDPVTGKKKPYWFSLPASPIFAFAGIWRPSDTGGAYAFLTCGYSDSDDPDAEKAAAAAHIVGAVHPKACPVILHPEDYDRWLTAPVEDALTLATAFPSQLMTAS